MINRKGEFMRRRFPISTKIFLLLGNVGIILIAVYLSTQILLTQSLMVAEDTMNTEMVIIMVVISIILFHINGLFSMENKRFSEMILSLFVSIFSLMFILMVFSFLFNDFAYLRKVFILTISLEFLGTAIWISFFSKLERIVHPRQQSLLIGSAKECSHVFNRLGPLKQFNAVLKYICTDYKQEHWKKIMKEIDLVIICSDISIHDKAMIVDFCNREEKEILLIPSFYEVFCTGMKLDKIDDIPVLRTQSLQPSLEQKVLKRIFDVFISGLAFVVSFPVMLFIAFIIKIFDSGPIIYSQIRTGQYGGEFRVYKFRTMRMDAEKNSGPVLATDNDPRITKLGSFMRATRLDELPQIWNVLTGDMSIVGPRPERPYFVEQYEKEIPAYVYRHNVKPGITGLAQVFGKYNTTAYDKLIYDLTYIQNCNIARDLIIMVQTIRVLVTKSATEGIGNDKENGNLENYGIKTI